ncbi:MAG: LL-diaminopimelate aminotransferase [Candidatus Omnitrophica bacterium]|nr:LL-diaminopimelate aminotransferase [Candidatus Omnitrophota bacterium]MDD5352682.1 LL-diaminopimelate aminotransferase [Candidatus Omnitrophota bacterium]MDD5550281.1 LL-diaminopimelate aminotransferase [Candidatus Omnitrophota bacterium]
MAIKIVQSDKLNKLPPYLFVEIDKAKRQARQEGRDIIDLGIGDPDQATPQFIVDKLYEAAKDKSNHRYALDAGMSVLRESISRWYKKRFNVGLNPDNEVLPLIGSKEGIAHFPLAVLNKGDYALVPDPCYPPYKGGTIFAGGKICLLPLLSKNNFLPDLKRIRQTVLKNSKIIFVNYPNNPTAAVATDEFYKELIQFALKNNIIVISDLAYSEIYFDGFKPRSLLEFEGAKDCVIEFHSLSKTYNMTGWRVGWACGNPQLVSLLAKVKSNIDSGIFQAIQIAAVAALDSGDSFADSMRRMYQERRDVLAEGLKSLGFNVNLPKATFYLWSKIPKRFGSSIELAKALLDKTNVVATPGVGFGEHGEGYIRFALTVPVERIKEAVGRLGNLTK